ncbi:transcription-repair coupling factor [Clostridiaceae bacterium M8S5]|nr:transcription-repair coupling factor [Clostridiaceae bacterium M8S5]
MEKNIFIDQMKNLKPYKKIVDCIKKDISPIQVHGILQENISHIAYCLNTELSNQILIVTHDEFRAKRIVEDLKFYGKTVEHYPVKQMLLYDIDAYSHEINDQRLKVMNKLFSNQKIIVVASIETLLNRVMMPETFGECRFSIDSQQELNLEECINNFIINGYERVDMVEGTGQFSVRGGLIDFFPSNSNNPVRIELFGDEVDSIRCFDLKDQRSMYNLDRIDVPPFKEVLIEKNQIGDISKKLQRDLQKSIKRISKESFSSIVDRLEEKFKAYIHSLNEGVDIQNINMLIPYVDRLTSILSYFNKNSLVILDDPQRIMDECKNIKEDFISKYTDLYERGELLGKHKDIYLDCDDILEDIKSKNCICMSSLLKNNKNFKFKEIISIVSKEIQPFHNKMQLIADELKRLKYSGYKIIIPSGTQERGKRLEKSLKELDVECLYTDKKEVEIFSGQVFITEGTISKGFEYPELKLMIISDREIFGVNKKKRTSKSKESGRKISSFTDLKIGDYVVHESHGIGKYTGIEQLDVQGIKKDYMCIKYSGEDKLFVPVEQMDLIQKYIGADSVRPKINKLGSGDWIKTKNKVKKSIEDMAKDLLELYAKRHMQKGHEFLKDTLWQKQFEDMFPYEETPDQLKCIKEIKDNMQKKEAMDRLLCGDVGYGKTEVALRAAFKAVMESKQVAILVPTTILAQQHYNTIVNRFKDFPVKVEMLSRFRTPSQQKKILSNLKGANLDIIVGTHRMLSKDVIFHDLGLLIIDEEQRFGVKHKEKIKQIKENIDVLTLTATPIPRTLHMSLIGVRDMSLIEEPPEERYPIQTYVMEYNDQLVVDAIKKEMNRNGQVYFVYNRVKSIKKMASRIKALVPEARIAVGHGQMSERELEHIMIDYLNGEYDVLVCTTIIETGLDIPNVNTMIVYDADKMGLSQLYQLRGRVGRSNKVAFAYFTYEKDKVLSEIAEKRLKAIKEFTEFGSGFKIAMRDLEIRGAGNILGSEQHGHMAAIGYDLYVKYLEETVDQLKGKVKEKQVDTAIELNVNCYIPKRYIQNEQQKVDMYKKISTIKSLEDTSDTIEELIDRYGDLPKEVENLIKIAYIKSICRRNHILSVEQKKNIFKVQFDDVNVLTPVFINEFSQYFRRGINFDLSKTPGLKYKLNNTSQNSIISTLEKIVNKIDSLNNRQIDI